MLKLVLKELFSALALILFGAAVAAWSWITVMLL